MNAILPQLSIQKKLILMIMGITSIILFSSLGIFISIELNSLNKTMHEDLSILADLLGKNSSAAIMFHDSKAAEENLRALSADPHIVSAHLLTDKKKIFAHYIRDSSKIRGSSKGENSEQHEIVHRDLLNEVNMNMLLDNPGEDYFYIDDHIHLLKSIIFEQDQSVLGIIHIESDRELYWQRVADYTLIIIIMISIALGLTLLFAYRAQKTFTDPILKLLNSMQQVSKQHNYTNLLDNHYHDEFGQLIKGFNDMLVQVNKHEQTAKNYQKNLEKRVEERTLQLQKARDKALSASRTKSIFLANMSHEIRTPMNAILGYTQLLQQAELNKNQSTYLDIIDKSGKHLLGLINDILELSKIEAGTLFINKSDFDLFELIKNIENMFKMVCQKKNINWRMQCYTDEPIFVNGDKGKLNQILINLIGNACKFTEQGEILFILDQIAANRYQFTVKDTGIGIEPQALSKIFDAFHQEEQSQLHGGTGLGLYISKRHIELMSGKIDVVSQTNKGSAFTFIVELLAAGKSFVASEMESISLYTLKAEKRPVALVVDDMKDNIDLLSSILSQIGFKVVSALNGQQALDEIEKKCPDIVYMDIRMPVMDGIEAIEKIRLKFSSEQLKCIAVSASNMRHKADYYINKGFDFFISKPFRFDVIYYTITDILGLALQAHEKINTQDEAEADISAVVDIKLKKEFSHALRQASEYGQLTELSRLVTGLKEYGQAGELAADHLQSLVKTADLTSISKYVKELTNGQID